jgi:hypothetical protein
LVSGIVIAGTERTDILRTRILRKRARDQSLIAPIDVIDALRNLRHLAGNISYLTRPISVFS